MVKDHELVKLSTYAANDISVDNTFAPNVENEADLILSRADGIFNWQAQSTERMFICNKHALLFGQQYQFQNLPRRKKGLTFYKCGFPDLSGLSGHGSVAVKARARSYLSKDQSEAILGLKDVLVPVGMPLCNRHSNVANDLFADFLREKKSHCLRLGAGVPLEESPIISQRFPKICQSQESELMPTSETDDTPQNSQATQCEMSTIRSSIRQIAKAACLSNVHFPDNFETLSQITKERYALSAKAVVRKIIAAWTPVASNEFYDMVIRPERTRFWLRDESVKLKNIMFAVASCFHNAPSSGIRKQCLSLITPFISFAELQEYLPGISNYYYVQSRIYAKKYGTGSTPEKMTMNKIRYNKMEVEKFISFITSPNVVVDMPFGFAKIKASDGKVSEVPNVVHTMVNERIVEQYVKYRDELGQSHNVMSRSSLLRILHYCTAQTRKSLLGLDYFTYKVGEAFDTLNQLLEQVDDYSDPEFQMTVRKLKELRQYLKVDYKLHVKEKSRIPDHCATFALSDSTMEQHKQKCDHDHDLSCQNCEQLRNLLNDVKAALNEKTFHSETEKHEAEFLFETAEKDILEWKKHQLRTVHQEKAKTEQLEKLTEREKFIFNWIGL